MNHVAHLTFGLALLVAITGACNSEVRDAAASAPNEVTESSTSTDLQHPEKPKTPVTRSKELGPIVTLHPGNGEPVVIKVELALTDKERARGLMYRKSMPRDVGMLFRMDRISNHSFWMKNTLIPLDMIFISPDGEVVGIVENAEPKTLKGRSVGRPSKYILELNGGECAAKGITAGTWVDLSKARLP